MRLPTPFLRFPLQFDAARLQAEVASLPASAWATHPNDIDGNSCVRLISADGGENDQVYPPMAPTVHLQGMPYVRQILAGFGVVWSRSRLMRLDAHSTVPDHADINYHWFARVRLHIPVVTDPRVIFSCGNESVHMAAGEAWLFDNWRRHHVDNNSDITRIHLVADTTGSSDFWRLAFSAHGRPLRPIPFDSAASAPLMTEQAPGAQILPPAEVELILQDLSGEVAGQPDGQIYQLLLNSFLLDWRQTYQLFGEANAGWPAYEQLRDRLRAESRTRGARLVAQTNAIPINTVLEGRLLRHLVREPAAVTSRLRAARTPLERPVFIVSAPRSGSTLLYETLAVSPQLHTLGGEAHWLVEDFAALRPDGGTVTSNRLSGAQVSDEIADQLPRSVLQRLQPAPQADTALRWLEKTPKNSLRIPFFDRLFPDARFVFLWRDPRDSIASIIEAWNCGRFVTYRQLPGWDGPWSLLLPPGWQSLRGQPRSRIAAFQWDSANRIVLDDLAALPTERWTSLSYADFLADPHKQTLALCEFVGIDFDQALQTRLATSLPMSRYTTTPPATDKWRAHEAEIEALLPSVQLTWDRLKTRP